MRSSKQPSTARQVSRITLACAVIRFRVSTTTTTYRRGVRTVALPAAPSAGPERPTAAVQRAAAGDDEAVHVLERDPPPRRAARAVARGGDDRAGDGERHGAAVARPGERGAPHQVPAGRHVHGGRPGRAAGVRPRAEERARRVRRAVGAGAVAQHVVHCAAGRVGQEQEGGVQVHEQAQDGLGHGHVCMCVPASLRMDATTCDSAGWQVIVRYVFEFDDVLASTRVFIVVISTGRLWLTWG